MRFINSDELNKIYNLSTDYITSFTLFSEQLKNFNQKLSQLPYIISKNYLDTLDTKNFSLNDIGIKVNNSIFLKVKLFFKSKNLDTLYYNNLLNELIATYENTLCLGKEIYLHTSGNNYIYNSLSDLQNLISEQQINLIADLNSNSSFKIKEDLNNLKNIGVLLGNINVPYVSIDNLNENLLTYMKDKLLSKDYADISINGLCYLEKLGEINIENVISNYLINKKIPSNLLDFKSLILKKIYSNHVGINASLIKRGYIKSEDYFSLVIKLICDEAISLEHENSENIKKFLEDFYSFKL